MKKIRAISLWEPWASLIATGAKTVETRPYHTSVRGELLICAAQTGKGIKVAEETGLITGAAAYSGRELCVDINDEEIELNFGKAVAVVNLARCISTGISWQNYLDSVNQPLSRKLKDNMLFGDYSEGRFAWVFDSIKRIKKPFPVKGKQGFFFVEMPEDVEFV